MEETSESLVCQAELQFGNQVLVVVLVKGRECETKVALDEPLPRAVAPTMQGCQPYVAVMTLMVVDLVAATVLEAVDLAVDPVLQKRPASVASSDAFAPSADRSVVEAPAVEAQGRNLLLLLQTSWFSSVVVWSASL